MTITYKTTLNGEERSHKIEDLTNKEAEAIAYDFTHGDFGDLIIYDLEIKEE
jgi:hypothetical protein